MRPLYKTLMLLLLCLTISPVWQAAVMAQSSSGVQASFENGKMNVWGTIGSSSGLEATIKVTNPSGRIVHFNQGVTGPGGSFLFSFGLVQFDIGSYAVQIGASGMSQPIGGVFAYDGTMKDTLAPQVPAGLAATPGDGKVELAWNASSGADLAGYYVYMNGSRLNNLPLSLTAYTATGLTNGTTYTFQVSSVDTSGNESFKSTSAAATPSQTVVVPPPDTTPPAIPGGVAAEAGDRQVALSWNTVTDADLAGYKVYRDGAVIAELPGTETSYTATGLTNGTVYTFQVSSFDTSGNESAKSSPAAATPSQTIVVPPPDTTAPAVPGGVAADAGDGFVELNWNAVTDADLAGYKVYRNGVMIAQLTSVETSYKATGLTNGTVYTFQVSSLDTSGNESAKSSPTAATPSQTIVVPPPDTTAPAVPTGVAGEAALTSVTLRWTAGKETDLAGYFVYKDDVRLNDTPLTNATYSVTNLSSGTSYTFQISAVDQAGNESARSEMLTISTLQDNRRPGTSAGGSANPGNSGTQSVTASTVAVTNVAPDANGQAKIGIDEQSFGNAANHAAADGTGRIEIVAFLQAGTKEAIVSIPASAWSQAAGAGVKEVAIQLGSYSIVIPMSAIQGAASSGGQIEISAVSVDNSQVPGSARSEVAGKPVVDFKLQVGGEQVSTFENGASLKIGFAYEVSPEEAPDRIIVYYINDSGELEPVKFSLFSEGEAIFLTQHFSMFTAMESKITFPDVAGNWSRPYVEALAGREIVDGLSMDRFGPDERLTRAQLVKLLISSFDLADPAANAAFDDVPSDSWVYSYVASAYKLGLVQGMGDGRFGADEPITREDMAVITHRAMKLASLAATSNSGQSMQFRDSALISSYAKDAIAALTADGVLEGTGEGQFEPRGFSTRGQAAKLVWTLLKRSLQ